MRRDVGPIYAQLRGAVLTCLEGHGYHLVRETYAPGDADWPAWDRGRADFAGAGPPVALTWDGAYRWLHLQVGEALEARWSAVLPPPRGASPRADAAELLEAAAAAIAPMCEGATAHLGGGPAGPR